MPAPFCSTLQFMLRPCAFQHGVTGREPTSGKSQILEKFMVSMVNASCKLMQLDFFQILVYQSGRPLRVSDDLVQKKMFSREISRIQSGRDTNKLEQSIDEESWSH